MDAPAIPVIRSALPLAADGDAALLVERELFEDVGLAQPVVVVGHAGAGPLDAGLRIAVVEQHQPVGVRAPAAAAAAPS